MGSDNDVRTDVLEIINVCALTLWWSKVMLSYYGLVFVLCLAVALHFHELHFSTAVQNTGEANAPLSLSLSFSPYIYIYICI